MAGATTNYGLVKPTPEEFYDVNVTNQNMDKIDTELKAANDKAGQAETNAKSYTDGKVGDLTTLTTTNKTNAVSAINEVKAHTTDENNPHKTTAAQVGAVAKGGDTMTGPLTLSGDPTQPLHAVTKQYADALKQGLDVKDSVRAATTGNITLSGTQTIDGVALAVGNRVLVKNQTTASQNGIYVVQSGSWARATDADTSAKVTSGMFVFVEDGTVNGDNGFVLTTSDPITLGTTALAFVQFSGAGQITPEAGLYKNGNKIGISDNGVTDLKIGDRTIDQATATAFSNTGKLTQILSWFAKVIKGITGKTNWYDAPSKTLEDLSNVQNYGVASTAEAEAGTTDAKYMTPLKTKQALQKYNSNSGTSPFVVTRTGALTEAVKVYVDDSNGVIHYVNDEFSSRFKIIVENTDTENATGTRASTHTFEIVASNTGASVLIDGKALATVDHNGFATDESTGTKYTLHVDSEGLYLKEV